VSWRHFVQPGEPLRQPGDPLRQPGDPLRHPGAALRQPGTSLRQPGTSLDRQPRATHTYKKPPQARAWGVIILINVLLPNHF
jgi:hypothetical protein